MCGMCGLKSKEVKVKCYTLNIHVALEKIEKVYRKKEEEEK
jgi:NifU-like protein involved in Fe-S cluster formation